VNIDAVPAAILAGGLATRLGPLTSASPKALIDINGEPFIGHQLRLLHDRGVRRVVLCLGYLGEMVADFVDRGQKFGIDVEYSFDGPTLLGTAGALRRAAHLLGPVFMVFYGDSYLPCDYREVLAAFEAQQRPALMTVYRNENRYDRSNAELANGRILAYDKRHPSEAMNHIDYGLGVLRASCLELVPSDQPYDLANLYQDLLADGQLGAYEVHERFHEVGSIGGIEEMREYLRLSTETAGGHQ
jgi:N-acetyl-alpha-D-muramate 1-phosphate uridylyltransferase